MQAMVFTTLVGLNRMNLYVKDVPHEFGRYRKYLQHQIYF
jgi:hypothetical protein